MFQIPRPSRATLLGAAIALGMVMLMSCVRPLGVLFLGLFSYWLYWTRCSYRVVLTPELREKFESWLRRADNWRHNSPSMFCLVSTGCLATFAVLGHLLSGSVLVMTLLVVSAVVSTKYNFKLVHIERRDFQWSERINYYNADAELDDEFMPDVNESNLFVLERASDVATISSPTDADGVGDADDDDRSDDVPSELLIPDCIPEIDEHSTDEDDELVPLSQSKHRAEATAARPQPQQQQYEQSSQAKDNASTEDKTMDFRRGHFKRDSSLSTTSSSSEESLSKGLQFPDHTSVDAGGPSLRQLTAPPTDDTASSSSLLALAVKTQAQALLPSLVSNLVQWGATEVDSTAKRRQVTALDSSDESDFEILETDDFK
ncbi:uncharacterized protein LOC111603383 [Drosophila hydei]|uniref:Uncharacterized protein LOC111603383 n=1 Tax=Drosophila hydei TaxID=7224 RepID=A0A6J2SPB0_DROHY|nr:uncharacterized protein LOC111603383 [Drosophila hydei]XP_030079539.1 uncharacterized protein LOC111603383 [Drosophila hydei]XP_030079540.1 uncharacterized protein LOC111603383 [Drosophila hydei]XP_030079541.1 uncharacterized protein LOC111603383 [Drosophila hydei]XP_030079542.1 uncharacterized protein LOC111603383 [Drosophila hydei]XP_030079543.1 uncharacterized protein LOC111603383 [Drosophila hydei]